MACCVCWRCCAELLLEDLEDECELERVLELDRELDRELFEEERAEEREEEEEDREDELDDERAGAELLFAGALFGAGAGAEAVFFCASKNIGLAKDKVNVSASLAMRLGLVLSVMITPPRRRSRRSQGPSSPLPRRRSSEAGSYSR